MEVFERIKEIRKAFFHDSNLEFASFMGEKPSTTSGWVSGKRGIGRSVIDKLSDKMPNINTAWLLTGEGEMLKSDTSDKSVGQKTAFPSDTSDKSASVDFRLVPIIHIDSVGGMHSANSIVAEPQYVEGYAPFTDAKEGDICIIQSGDSMVPTCPSGSLLLLRQVTNWREYMGYGNIFVIELTDGRRITKEITRYDANPQEYVWCVSHNPNVPDEELPKKLIASVWKVIKIQIDKGW